MIETVTYASGTTPLWIDVVDPRPEELTRLAAEYALAERNVTECLDPEHLPKAEVVGETLFLILRAYDEVADPLSETAQKMTRKVAVFATKEFLITIHRTPRPFLTELKRRVRVGEEPETTTAWLVLRLVEEAVETFWAPLDVAEAQITRFEQVLFGDRDVTAMIQGIYRLKRRIMVVRWMGRHTQTVIQRLRALWRGAGLDVTALEEEAQTLYFAADELLDDATALLNTQLAYAAHKTNEVIRVLTLFSIFFLPLTFIVGVYGMNFHHMPELKHPWGYPAVWVVMLATVAALAAWFWRKGWMR